MSFTKYFTGYAPMGMAMDLGKEVPEEMQVQVYYTLGGSNYFSGGTTRRGIYVSFTPVRRSNTSITTMMFDDRGRKLLLQETKAKNAKAGEYWAQIIRARLQGLAQAAIARDWDLAARLADSTSPTDKDRDHTPTPRGWDQVEGGVCA